MQFRSVYNPSHSEMLKIIFHLLKVDSLGYKNKTLMMISIFKITYFQPCSQKMHNLILTFFGINARNESIVCRCCPVGMTNKIDISWFRNVSPSKESMNAVGTLGLVPNYGDFVWIWREWSLGAHYEILPRSEDQYTKGRTTENTPHEQLHSDCRNIPSI